MSPELLVRMFETIENVSMVKESTGDLSGCAASTSSAAVGCRYPKAVMRAALEARDAGAAGWCTAAPCLRPQPCIDLYEAVRAGELPRALAIYAALKPLLEFIVAGGLATTVKAGLALLGVGVGDPRRPLLPLEDEGRAALRKLLAGV